MMEYTETDRRMDDAMFEAVDSLMAELLDEESDRFERIVYEGHSFDEAVEIAGELGRMEKYSRMIVEATVAKLREFDRD
jgi:hypothetical protein